MPKKKIGKPLHDIDFEKFSEKMHDESDRASAILGAALLDAKLEAVCRRCFQACQDDLLSDRGAIATFSARIYLARALAWISEDAFKDLNTIRSIRNDFAHSFDYDIDFNTPSIADRCRTLRTAQAYIDGFELAMTAPNQNASKAAIRCVQDIFKRTDQSFKLAVDFLSQYLDGIIDSHSDYTGSDLLDEIRSLSAKFRFEFKARCSILPASTNAAP